MEAQTEQHDAGVVPPEQLISPRQALERLRQILKSSRTESRPVRPGELQEVLDRVAVIDDPLEVAGALRDELFVRAAAAIDGTGDSTEISALAIAITSLDQVAGGGDDRPQIGRDLVKRSVRYLERCAQALGSVEEITYRKIEGVPGDLETPGPARQGRILPAGFEDLDPAQLLRTAESLRAAIHPGQVAP